MASTQLCQNTVKKRVADIDACFYLAFMNNKLPPILQFVQDAQVFNLSKLDNFCGFPRGTISRAIKGRKQPTNRQLQKLTHVFWITKIGPLSVIEQQFQELEQRLQKGPKI